MRNDTPTTRKRFVPVVVCDQVSELAFAVPVFAIEAASTTGCPTAGRAYPRRASASATTHAVSVREPTPPVMRLACPGVYAG
jgi:hypothetical protein